ncbi:MAG: acetate--CoA ligase family protein [Coriobacteriia bacterium]|nr:acetate--CoA ligase family protein [Coriobacteriia bacterium]
MSENGLDKLFNPQSIAVIGASNRKGSVGYILLRNIISSEYTGIVYPVNHRSVAVQGILAYPSVGDIPGGVDMAAIAVPAQAVPETLRQCGEAGVKGAVIITAGFKEAGPEGVKLEQEIAEIAKGYGIRVLGPNCLGYCRPPLGLDVTFAKIIPGAGNVAFLSQSGAIGTAILDWACANNLGFSAFVSMGSMMDAEFGDLIEYFDDDPNTSCIIMYVESLTDARKFMSAARRFAKNKPIVVAKSGRTARSALAAASHTGALAGDDAMYSTAFRRAGVLRVDEMCELFDASELLARMGAPRGKRLAILTNAGGPGVMASDLLIKLGGELAELGPETTKALEEALPPMASSANPVDVLGDAPADRYEFAVKKLMADPSCDGILVILTPQANTEPTRTAQVLVEAARTGDKPLLTSFMGEIMVAEAQKLFRQEHVPVFETPERAVRAYMNLYAYTCGLEVLAETPAATLPGFEPDRDQVRSIFAQVAEEGREILSEFEAKQVLDAYEIPTVKTVTATSAAQAASAAAGIGFPVALKIHSNDITHKSDVGGIALNIQSEAEAAEAYSAIMERVTAAVPAAEIIGVTVQEMSRGGHEVIVGAKKDPTFGPALVFGMGGTGVELFKDVAVELPPINQALAKSMIKSTKVSTLLEGYRGAEPVDMDGLEQALVKASYLLVDFPEILEMDINPLQARPDGLCALDARVVIDPEAVGKADVFGAHLVVPV